MAAAGDTVSDPLAQAVVDTAGQPASLSVGTVLSADPLTIDLGAGVINPAAIGFLNGVNLLPGTPVAMLGQSVAGADSSASTWLALGTPSPSPTGVIGTNFWTGGDMSVGVSAGAGAGAEAAMIGAWGAGSTINFTFPPGCVAKMRVNGVIYQGTAFLLNGTARIRKNGPGGTTLLAFAQGIPPGTLALSQCFEYTSYLKNDTATPITLTLYATAQRAASGGAGNWILYGDAATPLIVTVELLGSIPANSGTAAIAVQV